MGMFNSTWRVNSRRKTALHAIESQIENGNSKESITNLQEQAGKLRWRISANAPAAKSMKAEDREKKS